MPSWHPNPLPKADRQPPKAMQCPFITTSLSIFYLTDHEKKFISRDAMVTKIVILGFNASA